VTNRYRPEGLREFAAAVLERLGLAAPEADGVAEVLVDAECRGVPSHGLLHLPMYARMLRQGEARPDARPRLLQDTGPLTLVDGDAGLGPVVGRYGMNLAIERARRFGVGIALTRNTNTFGAAAFYVEMAVRQGMAAVVCSNSAAVLAPHGTAAPLLGTNPLAIGVPALEEPPVIVDMACSVTAWGNIIMARDAGEPTTPPGWALNREGAPATSPVEALAGALLPFGAAKGGALAVGIELLTGALSGAAFDEPIPDWPGLVRHRKRSQWLMAIDIGRLRPLEEFQAGVDSFARQLRRAPRAPGVAEVRLPGERAARVRQQAVAEGVSLASHVERDLLELARSCSLTPPESTLSGRRG
jgi:LDH2 family malate/lactate/ureidoglycolate dehydrogenase